jgi:hypothetical protein
MMGLRADTKWRMKGYQNISKLVGVNQIIRKQICLAINLMTESLIFLLLPFRFRYRYGCRRLSRFSVLVWFWFPPQPQQQRKRDFADTHTDNKTYAYHIFYYATHINLPYAYHIFPILKPKI